MQKSQLENIVNEWKAISLILAIYDMYGFREHGRITGEEIDSTERIKEALRDRLGESGYLDNMRKIYLGEDRLIYVRYLLNGSEVLLRLAPEDLKDGYRVIWQGEDIVNGFKLQIVDEDSERFVSEVGVILEETIEKFPPMKPVQCVNASRYICNRLNKIPDVIALERSLFIPSDCSLSIFTGTAHKRSHTIAEIKHGDKYYVVDTQLLQFKENNKLNLPDEFINQHIYTPEEYYTNVPCFWHKYWPGKWEGKEIRIDGPFLPKKYKEIISHYRINPDVGYKTKGYDEESVRFAISYMEDIVFGSNRQLDMLSEIIKDLFILINNKNIPEETLGLLLNLLFRIMDMPDDMIKEESKQLIYQGINDYLTAQEGFRELFFSELIKYFDNPESDNFRKRIIEYIEKNMKALVGLGYCRKIIEYFINHLKSKRLSITEYAKSDLETIESLMQLISKFEFTNAGEFKKFRRELVQWHLNHPEERLRDYSLECIYQINENLAKCLGFHPGQNELLRNKIKFHSEYCGKDISAKKDIDLTKIRGVITDMTSRTNLIKDSLFLIFDIKVSYEGYLLI